METGWWYTYPSEKYEFVSWDYYSQYIYIWKMKNVPNHQPGKLKEQVHNPTAMCCCSSLL